MVSSNNPSGAAATVAPAPEIIPDTAAILSVDALADLVGAELKQPVDAMQAVIDAYAKSRELNVEQAQELLNALHVVRVVAQRTRQVGRAMGGNATQAPQVVRMDELAHEVLRQYEPVFEQFNINVRATIKPTKVVADPGLVEELLNSVVGWAVDGGAVVSFLVKPVGNPEHPVLAATVRHHWGADGVQSVRAGDNTLGWQVISQLTRSMGLTATRTNMKDGYVLSIDFPELPDLETIRELEGTPPAPWWQEE